MSLDFEYVCSVAEDIPNQALDHLNSRFIERMGEPFDVLFPEFSSAFGLTSDVFERRWSRPKLVLQKGNREWLSGIALESEETNIFFYLQPEFMDNEGPVFELYHQMLPACFREFYRFFNSFSLTRSSHFEMNWRNTPFRYEARVRLDDFASSLAIRDMEVKEFAKRLGLQIDNIHCWLYTDSGDALFIDDESDSGRVFYANINIDRFNNVIELKDPCRMMDTYLSRYLYGRGEALAKFDI